jgi:hypothetical protein
MLARLGSVVLLTLSLLASSGCTRCCRGWHDGNYCAPSCGECYWSEWFNDPPACCDPCDCYGNYAGHRRRPVTHAGYHAPEPTLASPEMIDEMETTPTPATPTPGQPTPAYPGIESTEGETTETAPMTRSMRPTMPAPGEVEGIDAAPGEAQPGDEILNAAPDTLQPDEEIHSTKPGQSIDDALGE